MSPGIQWALVVLAALSAAGTLVRAYVAYRTWKDWK
jgi:hypothetical protein